jgi:hypothetical protein
VGFRLTRPRLLVLVGALIMGGGASTAIVRTVLVSDAGREAALQQREELYSRLEEEIPRVLRPGVSIEDIEHYLTSRGITYSFDKYGRLSAVVNDPAPHPLATVDLLIRIEVSNGVLTELQVRRFGTGL